MYWHAPNGPDEFVLALIGARGNVAAEGAARDLLEAWCPDVVMLLGIAGGLSTGDAVLGDVVVPDYVHYGEFRKIKPDSDCLRFLAYDQPTYSLRMDTCHGLSEEPEWLTGIAESRPVALSQSEPAPQGDPKVHMGALVAGEKILSDPDHPEQDRVFVTFDNAIAVDMESYGVAYAVHRRRDDSSYNPRLTIIRGVSDIVTRRGADAASASGFAPLDDNDQQRAHYKRYATATAAAFAAAVVQELTSDLG